MDRNKHTDKDHSFWANFNPGFIVAGAATLVTSWLSIGHNFYKNLYENETFAKENEARQNSITEALANKSGNTAETISKIQKANKNYSELTSEALKEAGIKNTFDKWRTLKGYQKANVGLTVATVTSIALGALYSFNKNKSLSKKLREQEQENKELQRS